MITGSSPIATQLPHAAGLAYAAKLRGEDRVAVSYFGEGATSKGDFHEALNFAGIHQLPVRVRLREQRLRHLGAAAPRSRRSTTSPTGPTPTASAA